MWTTNPKALGTHPLVDRRTSERIDVTWSVDCETEDTFLYASIANISEIGIFVSTREPLRSAPSSPCGSLHRARANPSS